MDPSQGTASRRLFVGAFLHAAGARVIHGDVRGLLAGAGFRFVPPEEIHMTLAFLGETDTAVVPGLVGAIRSAVDGLAGPRLLITHTGSFPEQGSARVLWVGVEEDAGTEGRLEALAQAVRGAAASAGVDRDPEAGFQAHLTVARPSRFGRCLPPEDFRRRRLDVRWAPASIRLVESHPGQAGESRFPLVAEFALSPDPA
jgi:2'-5' RNA ligase